MFGPGAFRLFLATMVLVSHVTTGRFGVVAVMAFFILSGYWVTRMYQEKYLRTPRPVPTFYISRFLRLWPAFAVAVLIAMALRGVRGEVVNLLQLEVLPMLGVASGVRDPLEISWSLDIEMQFYLLLPFLIMLAPRVTAPALRLAAVCLIGIAGWGFAYLSGYETIFQYLPAFAAGMAIYLHDIHVTRRAAWLSVAAFIVVGAALASNTLTAGAVYEVPMNRRLVQLISLVWGLTLVPFAAWNVRQRGAQLDRRMGDFSYSLYLIHFPVIKTVGWLLGSDMASAYPLAKIAASFVAALLFFVIVDRNFERLRLWVVARFIRQTAPAH